MTRRLKILLGALVVAVVLSVVLVAVDLLPALARARQRREELKRIDAEIRRSLLEVKLRTAETRRDRNTEVPEIPEIASFITSLRRAGEKAGVDAMTFDVARTEKQEIAIPAGESEDLQEYVVSNLSVSLTATLAGTVDFLGEILTEGPDETFDHLRIMSRSAKHDKVDVSMTVRLHGIPR